MKNILVGHTLATISLIFLGTSGLCFLQLRSLYIRDLATLQTNLEQQSIRLDERVRRSIVAVDSLQSEFSLQLKHQESSGPTEESNEFQDHILKINLKAVPDALRVYFVAPKQEAIFFPESRSERHEPSLLNKLFFQLGTPNVNRMRSAYWTTSQANDFGEMIISRASPVYVGDRFAGVVGVDTLLDNLVDTIDGEVYGNAQIFVTGTDRKIALHNRSNQKLNTVPSSATSALPSELQPHLEKILQGKSGEIQSMQGYVVIHYSLENISWNTVLWIPNHQIWLTTIKTSFWTSIVPWLTLMMLLVIITLEVQRRAIVQQSLILKSAELATTLTQLKETQSKLVQNEKMSSLSQLVGGIAHEINNPVSFIHGNLEPAQEYVQSLLELLDLYEKKFPTDHPSHGAIAELSDDIDCEFIKSDLVSIMESMGNGTERIREIVLLLRNFARMDEAALKSVDLHEGLESTLELMHYRCLSTDRRPEITIKRQFSNLPQVECYAGQLNQVFMGLISNAIDAINDCPSDHFNNNPPTLKITTAMLTADRIQIRISDNGLGIPDAIQDQIFDPFFTTKAVGKGTGLGLAIAHQVITERHGGTLIYNKEILQVGTAFTITLPIQQTLNVPITPPSNSSSEFSRPNPEPHPSLNAIH